MEAWFGQKLVFVTLLKIYIRANIYMTTLSLDGEVGKKKNSYAKIRRD
jgi:hypothetical protein